MFSTATLVSSGIGAIVGCLGGGAFAHSEKVGQKNNTLMKIAKIASVVLLAGAVGGSLTLGLCTLATIKGTGYAVFLATLILLHVGLKT